MLPSLFLAAQVSLSLSTHTTNLTYERSASVSMPRCRGRPYIPRMLPFPLLPVVEYCLSSPSYGTDERCLATHEFGVRQIWLLLSWIRRMNRAFLSFLLFLFRFFRFSSVSSVSLPFLSFLLRFFRFFPLSSVSFIPPFSFRFCSLPVCCDRLAPTLHTPFYQTTDFPTNQSGRP